DIVADGKTVTVTLELEAAPREPPPPPPPAPVAAAPKATPPDEEKPDEAPVPASNRRMYGAIVGGGGVALIATSLVFGTIARGKWNDVKKLCGDDATCEPTQSAEGRKLSDAAHLDANIATGLAISGAVALGVGAYLWFTAPSSRNRTALQLRPGAGPASLGLTVLGGF